jgi:hypothetical protein
MDMAPRPKGPKKTPGIGTLLKRRRQLGGKK